MRIEQIDKEQQLLWEGYSPEKIKEALRTSAGALGGIDVSSLLRDLHKARQQRSKGRPDA